MVIKFYTKNQKIQMKIKNQKNSFEFQEKIDNIFKNLLKNH